MLYHGATHPALLTSIWLEYGRETWLYWSKAKSCSYRIDRLRTAFILHYVKIERKKNTIS